MESHFRTRQILSFPNELENQRSWVMMCTTSALLGFGNTFNKVQMLECIAKNNCNSLQELFLPNLHSESGYIMCHQSLSRSKGSIKMQFRDESWRLTAVRQKTQHIWEHSHVKAAPHTSCYINKVTKNHLRLSYRTLPQHFVHCLQDFHTSQVDEHLLFSKCKGEYSYSRPCPRKEATNQWTGTQLLENRSTQCELCLLVSLYSKTHSSRL